VDTCDLLKIVYLIRHRIMMSKNDSCLGLCFSIHSSIQYKECILHVFPFLLGGCRMCGAQNLPKIVHMEVQYIRGNGGGGGTGPAERFPSMAPSQVNVRAWGGGGSALDNFVDLRSLLNSH
jgi:hypothetical protein